MRARTAAAFVLGLAVGMLGLGVVLWQTGRLQTGRFVDASAPPWKQPMVPVPGSNVNDLAATASRTPAPNIEPPPPPIQPPPSAGQAPVILGPPAVTARTQDAAQPAV